MQCLINAVMLAFTYMTSLCMAVGKVNIAGVHFGVLCFLALSPVQTCEYIAQLHSKAPVELSLLQSYKGPV